MKCPKNDTRFGFKTHPRRLLACQCCFGSSIQVIIITNSDDGWVRFSAERFVPNLVPVIEKYRIVSARTRYERFYPSQPLCWKAAAFAHEVNEIYEGESEMALNVSCESMESTDVSSEGSLGESNGKGNRQQREIISIGDSMEERTAVRIVSGQLSATPKSVMFISSPSPMQIIGQLNMLTSHMKFVCEHGSSLDLEISPLQAQRCAESHMERNKLREETSGAFIPRIRRAPSGTEAVVASGEMHFRME